MRRVPPFRLLNSNFSTIARGTQALQGRSIDVYKLNSLAWSKQTDNKPKLRHTIEDAVNIFTSIATCSKKSRLDALSVIGLLKLIRRGSQPGRVAEIWPHIKQLPLLPADDQRTSLALIGSVISAVVEAKDSTTAASVWSYLRLRLSSLPSSPLLASQLLNALSGQPELIEEVITLLHQGKLKGATADAQHYATAIRGLCDPKDVERGRKIYEMIATNPEIGVDKFVLNAMLTLYGADEFSSAKKIFNLAVKHKKVSTSLHFLNHEYLLTTVRMNVQVDAMMVTKWLQILGDCNQHELIEKFITLLNQGKVAGVTANAHHFSTALHGLISGKGDLANVERGRRIYGMIALRPEIGLDKFVLSAMMHLYGSDQFADAKKLFDLAVQHQKVSDWLFKDGY